MACSSEPNDTIAVDLDFEKYLEVALQDSPPDIAEQLKAGLRKRYDKPPLTELELCLGRSVPLNKARELLFSPNEEDMRLYAQLLAMPPKDAPDHHPQRSVQVCALASLYLVHSKTWERVRPLIEAGGLRQLAAALAHPNPYLASQAMSTLLHITDEELLFPWHDPPATPDGRGPKQGPYALVWRRMYDLSNSPFLPNLLAHYRHPPAFPGASGMALRLFAFYVSWMRKNFTQDGRLSLSTAILDLLQRWGADPQISEDEKQLAQQLHKDFIRFPTAQAPAASEGAAASHHLGGLNGTEDDEFATRVASERTEVNRGPSQDNEAEVLREQGNEAYKRGDYTAAIHLYSAALDVRVPAERLLTEAPRRAAYHANRAAAYMARASCRKLWEGDADTSGHLEGVDHGSEGAPARHFEAAVLDCDMALDLEPVGPAAAKTLLRKCRALTHLGRMEDAAAAARSGLAKCDDCTAPNAALRSELEDALRRAAQKQAVESGPGRAAPKSADGLCGLDGKTGQGGYGADGGSGLRTGAPTVVAEPTGHIVCDWNAMD